MSRRLTPAQIRECIRMQVFEVTGQRLSSKRIRLLTNPRANSRIAFNLATRRIAWIGIATTYWKGPIDVLRAVAIHEAMNTRIAYSITDEELREAEEILAAGDDSALRVSIRTRYEIDLNGWRRILERKLQVDKLCFEWCRDHKLDLTPYIQFLIEEWNAAQSFSEPRRKFHRMIGAKRVREAGIFFENCIECKENAL